MPKTKAKTFVNIEGLHNLSNFQPGLVEDIAADSLRNFSEPSSQWTSLLAAVGALATSLGADDLIIYPQRLRKVAIVKSLAFASVLFVFFTFITLPSSAVRATQDSRPNIVLIFIDDLGWKDIGCYGNDFVETQGLR